MVVLNILGFIVCAFLFLVEIYVLIRFVVEMIVFAWAGNGPTTVSDNAESSDSEWDSKEVTRKINRILHLLPSGMVGRFLSDGWSISVKEGNIRINLRENRNILEDHKELAKWCQEKPELAQQCFSLDDGTPSDVPSGRSLGDLSILENFPDNLCMINVIGVTVNSQKRILVSARCDAVSLLHEMGHWFDRIVGEDTGTYASETDEFKRLWGKEVGAYRETYLKENNTYSASEFFAELFAMYYSASWRIGTCPECFEYLFRLLSSYGWQKVSSVVLISCF